MDKENKTITSLLEQITEIMCDQYCKYSAAYEINSDEELDSFCEKYCSDCPLNLL